MMKSRRKRVDVNQPDITRGLRQLNIQYTLLSDVGDGVADMVVHWPYGNTTLNIFIEIKSGNSEPRKNQITFLHKSGGYVCYSVMDVLLAILDYIEKIKLC